MSTERSWVGSTVKASNALNNAAIGTGSLRKAITAAGAIAANGITAYGLLMAYQNSGEHATVGIKGEMKFVAANSIGPGTGLTVTTSGYVTNALSGTYIIGRNAELGVLSGDLGRGIFDFTVPVYLHT